MRIDSRQSGHRFPSTMVPWNCKQVKKINWRAISVLKTQKMPMNGPGSSPQPKYGKDPDDPLFSTFGSGGFSEASGAKPWPNNSIDRTLNPDTSSIKKPQRLYKINNTQDYGDSNLSSFNTSLIEKETEFSSNPTVKNALNYMDQCNDFLENST